MSQSLEGYIGWIHSVEFSPDGKCIVAGSEAKMICVWDVETGAIVSGPFEWHTGPVTSVTFSPDGKHIASGSLDRTIRVMEIEVGDDVEGPANAVSHMASHHNDASVNPFTIRANSKPDKDGWMLGSHSELLFWVPPLNRAGLWRPGNMAVIAKHSTQLDFSQFVHGTSWHKCKT
jgi:hypothetical protein